MKNRINLIALVFALTLCGLMQAQVPQLLNYQGRVAVGSTNFNGSGQFKFALVDTTGATTYWSNDGTSSAGSQPTDAVGLTVNQGLYSVQLGDTTISHMTAIPASVFNNGDVRLRVWFNDGTHGFQQLSPDQRIAAVGYAMMAATVPNGSITSTQIANGAVGTAQFAPNAYLNGTAANVPLSGVTGMDPTVQAAAANTTNAANGLTVLDSNGNVSPSNQYGDPLRVYQPTTTVGTTTTVAPFNMVIYGDSIVAGGGASIPYNTNYQGGPVPNSTAWPQSLQNLGFCSAAGTVWPLGMGGETTANAMTHFYSSGGQSCTVALTRNSTSGTLQGTPQFIVPNAIVNGPGIPTNTTMMNVQVATTATIPANSSTITVASGAGITNGMFVAILAYNPGSSPNENLAPNTTVISGGGTTTLTLSANTTAGSGTSGATVVFFSPIVTLSNAYVGPTTNQILYSGGTLITSMATFTSGSTTATVTGTTVGLTGSIPMGVGGMAIPPGSTATFNGTTMTLSAKATASGSLTFYASCITHDALAPTTFYPGYLNTTPFLLSPSVTGIPAYFICAYGLNDSSRNNGVSLGSFQSNYTSLVSEAISAGYTVIYTTIPPPTANNIYGNTTSLVAQYNGWLQNKPAALNGAYLIDVASQFPTQNVNGDIYHYSDGIHPSDLGHRMIAGYTNDCLFSLFASLSQTVTYPMGNGGINEYWLPAPVVKTDQSNTFGVLPINGGSGGTMFAQNIEGSMSIFGNYGSTQGTLNLAGTANSSSGGILNFGTNGYGNFTSVWSLTGNPTNFTISDTVNTGGLSIADKPNSNASAISGGWSVNDSGSVNGSGPQASNGLTVKGNAGTGCLMSNDFGASNDFIFKNLYGEKGFQFWGNTNTALGEFETTGLVLPVAGETVSLKGGVNATSGTVTLTGGSATITSTAITTKSVIFFSLVTASGTPGVYQPLATVSNGSATVTGLPTDNSTYNWAMILTNQ